MNFRQLILCSTFSVIYCQLNEPFYKTFIFLRCRRYETTKDCPLNYKRYGNSKTCITSMCSGNCENGLCILNYCYAFTEKVSVYKYFSECQHFRSKYGCDNCYCDDEHKICFCNEGYVINPYNKNCVPYCSKKCENGQCSAVEQCTCKSGYELSSNKYKCIPKCSPPCINGRCTDERKCLCNDGYYPKNNNCVPMENEMPKPPSCPEGHTLQNEECKPICEPNCGNDMECVTPNDCRCLTNFEWNNKTSKCEEKCSNCIKGKLEDGTCTCADGYAIDPNNKCECISKCIDGTCVIIKNETFFCIPKFKNYSNYGCEEFSVDNENYKVNSKMFTWPLKCEHWINGMCKKATCTCNETNHPMFPCDLVCNSEDACEKYNSDGSCEEKMKQRGSLKATLYIISASVVVGVIAIIITIIIIRKKLNQRASSESAGGPTSSLHLTKSYDEEIVDNVELYGSI